MNINHSEQIHNLISIGLNENQAKTYLSLVSTEKASVKELAKLAGVTRTTVYDNLELLEKIGLASKVIEKGKRYYQAESPNNLKQLLNERVAKYNELVNYLSSVYASAPHKPGVQFLQGIPGLHKMHELSLIGNSKLQTRFLGEIDTLLSYLPLSYVQSYVKLRTQKGIRNQIISSKSILDHKENYSKRRNQESLREARYIPDLPAMKTGFFNYEDTVWITPTSKQNYLIVIENQEFAETFDALFKYLWKSGKNVE